jgi:uncharacterized protein involved in exopolysaccharide biosynthesis
VLLAAIAFVFLVIRPENPELGARALIGLERTTDISGAKESVTANLGREDIMMSRTFLKEVARKLSLRLSTAPSGRRELFDSIPSTLRRRAAPIASGSTLKTKVNFWFTIMIRPHFRCHVRVSPRRQIHHRGVGGLGRDQRVDLPGMSLEFSRSVRARPHAFTFHVVDIRVAVEAVFRNLTIKRADPDKGINYIAVLLTGRDYALSAATVNAIADGFIEKNSGFRQLRSLGIVGSLDKQMQLSQANLASAEAKIRDFRSENPQVGLNQQTQQTVSSLAQLDNGIQNISADKVNAVRLKTEFLAADSSQRLRIAEQISRVIALAHSPSLPVRRCNDELAELLVQTANA